ncbi:hypothetical protein HYPBUDRAFT_131166 [Hyphopichia burtonii NRRL Y-1933]|uniref:Uncharacterized protein n=1 Tax=Hyphopichia burtonii NRRL Y-1933 TaxID=984485 RepID=A0A1E4RQP2_9ASCO|nr:hypothetical protein HYPBUDRAFT_131166 [Hyphopichia burtonii NRRL Y-1933]ODV69385.1 hypothetical protein HYPBUDRAFT_131166 [Hyphopichia burtonii NRRL Y-1933]
MNLMDMLSGDTPDSIFQNNDPQDMQSVLENAAPSGLEDGANGGAHPIQTNDGVYHLPTILTKVQCELAEFVLQVLNPVLLSEAHSKRQRASINSLLDNNTNDNSGMTDDASKEGEGNYLSQFNKINLLFDQLRIIKKHPSLLVDHFIPKKLLLLEINELLLNLSGKFQLFNRIVDSFIDRYSASKNGLLTNGYHILVVAESVKELELIEGLIIGKKLHYKNLNGSKLYDDNSKLPNFEKSNNYSYEKNQSNVTSQQLYNNYTPASNSRNSEFNLIISFDPDLDTKSPSIEIIRSKKNFSQSLNSSIGQELKTPVLIPFSIFTLDHIALKNYQPSSLGFFNNNDPTNPLFKWKLECLNTFVVNRFNLFDSDITEDFFRQNYGSNMQNLYHWFHNWDSRSFPLHDMVNSFNEKLILHYSDDKLINKLQITNVYDPNLQSGNISKKNLIHPSDKLEKFGYADYKKKLAELLNDRVLQLENAILEQFEKDIPSYRVRESLRQSTLDTKEDSIAEKYKVLRKLNEDATISEKKLLRVDNDLQKLENTNTELNDKFKYLNSAIKQVQESEEKLPEFTISQEQQLKELDLELTKLDDEYNKINEENEKIRANYQNSSSEAVQLSTSLVSWKEEKTHLSKKLNGPGIKLIPSLIQKDELINYELELTKLTRESDFVSQFFTKKLDKLIKDRTTILDNTTSGSSSRPGNRISRGSTPF